MIYIKRITGLKIILQLMVISFFPGFHTCHLCSDAKNLQISRVTLQVGHQVTVGQQHIGRGHLLGSRSHKDTR